MADNLDYGKPWFRISKELYQYISTSTDISEDLRSQLLEAFDNPLGDYYYAPCALIDTFEEEDWLVDNDANEVIYYFRKSNQPGDFYNFNL